MEIQMSSPAKQADGNKIHSVLRLSADASSAALTVIWSMIVAIH